MTRVEVLETNRLVLRRLTTEDALFILELVNEPGWLRFIGDKGVRTIEDARRYIRTGPVAMYERLGFGLYLTERKLDGTPIGMCGLVKRDSLADADIGFAFLARFGQMGYAVEAATAVKAYAHGPLGLTRIVAITDPDNERSIRVLEKLGMRREGVATLTEGAAPIALYS